MISQNPQSSLALYGGSKVRIEPFPERGHIGLAEKAAVEAFFDRAIASGQFPIYGGDEETAYCEEFAAYMGGGYVDAVSSGTAAIYVALQGLALEPFGEVIVGAFTDPGGLMPVPLLNLIPIIADTVPDSYNTGPDQVEAVLSPHTRAIIVPHIAGQPADIEGIQAVARRHGIPVIEDCAQAHAARLNGQLLGTFGDIAAFSTMGGKHHSSGPQGGLVYTRDETRYQKVRRASDRGKPFFLPPGATNPIAALNFNLNDLAAVIGRVQLRRLPKTISRRRDIAHQLIAGINALDAVSCPPLLPGAEASYWFLPMKFHPETATCDKDTFCEALRAEGLPILTDYRAGLPHHQDWFVNRRVFGTSGYPWASPDYHGDREQTFLCPNAQAMLDSHFNLMFHENWGPQEIVDALSIFQKVILAYHPSHTK